MNKISKLRLGDIVITNGGSRYVVAQYQNRRLIRINGWKSFDSYDENLNCNGDKDAFYSIKYIFRPLHPYALNCRYLSSDMGFILSNEFILNNCNRVINLPKNFIDLSLL